MTASQAHTMGPFDGPVGDEWALCSCNERFTGADRVEIRSAYQQHVRALTFRHGAAKARRKLTESIARGKPMPEEAAR